MGSKGRVPLREFEGRALMMEISLKMERPTIRNWEQYYQDNELEVMPWYFDGLDHDFDNKIKELGLSSGNVLDIGSGPGTQAMEISKYGFNVTGIDISPTAVKKAARLADQRHIPVKFIVHDILKGNFEDKFDYVFDRGCFHVQDVSLRADYVRNVSNIINKGGYLFLKCFSYKQEGTEGPHRIHPDEIREAFSKNFDIISIADTLFDGNHKPPPKGLFCTMKKR
ncbi:MAG: class I SAM-dependent methyltransferase [Nitrospirae bacterium]|nr:class I SAM-dependent methyltransferase [Nitrospirota bacterium]